MANSKHAHIRYNILDNCFRNKAFSFKQLLEYINLKIADIYPGEGISERTLRDDIKLFKDPVYGFGAPLEEMSRTYRYSDTNFSIASKPLLPYEKELIEASQQLLERFENNPKYNRLAEALIKFQDGEEDETDTSKILFYDQNEEYKGIKHLKPLYLAIQKKQVLQVKFKGFKDVTYQTFEFHPHILKQYNRRWFVFGYNKIEDRWQHSIPLDERLINFNSLDDVEYLESQKDWDTFFRTMVGVRRTSKEVEKVILKFHNGRENYFKTKPFIPDFEEFFEEDKQDQVWFMSIINPELIQQILSYGQDVEVVEPEMLKLNLKGHSNKMAKFYKD